MTHYFNSYEKKSFYREMTQLKESDIWIKEEVKRVHSDEPLHQALYVYCQSWLVEDLLMKADKMTMANSIELRVPFLDYRLVEWAARTPAWVKVAPNWIGKYETKWILRRFAKSRLPKEIIQRPKQGFPVPVYDWLGNKIKPWARDLLCSSDTRLFKWLVPQAVRNQVELGTTSQAKMIEKHRLWNLLILELWLREWNPQ
jgi:asparagine synthase (glutamine-hydrolysing)